MYKKEPNKTIPVIFMNLCGKVTLGLSNIIVAKDIKKINAINKILRVFLI